MKFEERALHENLKSALSKLVLGKLITEYRQFKIKLIGLVS